MNEGDQTSLETKFEPNIAEQRQTVVAGQPDALDIYRSLRILDDWFEIVRAYCADPPADQTRAAGWILDNDYQIVRALRCLNDDLPLHFYEQGPFLALRP